MEKKIIDISMELSNRTPQWPGDQPFYYGLTGTIEETGSVNVGEIRTGTHLGTHIDAPFHYDNDGLTIGEMPLEVYLSTAQVMDVRGLDEITSNDLKKPEAGVTTVLLRTGAWRDRTKFPGHWPVFDVSIASWMKTNGIRLLGVDVPSVDQETSKDMEMHQAMNRNGRYILESIILDYAEEGVYQLAALPLKIKGAEGSPVRAVLYT
ncbi:cyclase family protein [Planomicrobium sp. CPCC 101110]|uniref:cyclase family protein n=1 Tax=Planomicrobium sp. CPCC 101110 TaxID=2599619 RepID=UPI0011B5E438|nr:cyclase family protein [Planomicrobium sp. CPCC 101110]TWT24268.1 arylformamidase [Planomicrobium sp. CPCC 101110]